MNTKNFLDQNSPLLDVRSPSEFLHGHIPGALSFPLFSDSERAEIGTLYKQEGKDIAVKRGLHFVSPKLSSFIEEAERLTGSSKTLRLYCARGGMRSSSMAWLLQTAGFNCTLLVDGYKAFRRWALEQFEVQYPFFVLGGLTGSGKTDLLIELQNQGEQIIDLEDIANHKGSSFGHLGCLSQPSSEHFENILATKLSIRSKESPLWIEDESRMIGTCYMPEGLWKQMRVAPFLWIDSPKKDRIARLLSGYGNYNSIDMINSTQRLLKRLGAVKTNQIIQFIEKGELEAAIDGVLDYYDQTYLYSLEKKQKTRTEFMHTGSNQDLIIELKTFAKTQG